MFKILTVAREFGSGGGTLAQKIAETLGWELLDKALIDAIARTAQVDTETARKCDERVDSWVHRISRRGLWHGAFEGVAAVADAEFFDAETMAALARRVVAEAGARGDCVIVGRGAQCILQGHPEALHVFVYAPWKERVARVRARLKPSQEVEELMRATDQRRAAYIRTYFGCDWKDPHLYQLMISSQLGSDNLTRTILDAIQRGC
jgi:cytidylate kinase